jgi:hypothetical protein
VSLLISFRNFVVKYLHTFWYMHNLLDDISSVIIPRIFIYVFNTLLWDTLV